MNYGDAFIEMNLFCLPIGSLLIILIPLLIVATSFVMPLNGCFLSSLIWRCEISTAINAKSSKRDVCWSSYRNRLNLESRCLNHVTKRRFYFGVFCSLFQSIHSFFIAQQRCPNAIKPTKKQETHWEGEVDWPGIIIYTDLSTRPWT